MRVLGIDYGLKRIGLALSDEMKMIASPIGILKTGEKLEETAQIIVKHVETLEEEKKSKIEALVFGYPLHMDGRVGMMADEVKHLKELLEPLLNRPIHLWDERLTSVQADRSLRESSMTRKQRAKKVDEVSAAITLQSYLDSLCTL